MMPESLHGKGTTISIGTLVALVAALLGYQADDLAGHAGVDTKLAVVETKVTSIEATLVGIKEQLDKRDLYIARISSLETRVTVLNTRLTQLEQPPPRRRR